MKRRFRIVLLAVCLLSGMLSCQRGPESRPKPRASFVEEINALVDAPKTNLGQRRESIRARLGPWVSLETREVPNLHEEGKIDHIYTIKYEGLVLGVYEVVAYKKEMLLAATMTRNWSHLLPELIGLDREALEGRFGPPSRIVDGFLEYVSSKEDEAEELVRIKMKGNTVEVVEWEYYVD